MQMLLNAGILDFTSRFGEEGGYQTIGEALAGGFPVFLVGILTVFAVLAIIWGVLEIFHYLACTLPSKRQEKRENKTTEETPIVPAEDTIPSDNATDEEIVAVIAAAIAAAQAESPSGQFRVVSFRKK